MPPGGAGGREAGDGEIVERGEGREGRGGAGAGGGGGDSGRGPRPGQPTQDRHWDKARHCDRHDSSSTTGTRHCDRHDSSSTTGSGRHDRLALPPSHTIHVPPAASSRPPPCPSVHYRCPPPPPTHTHLPANKAPPLPHTHTRPRLCRHVGGARLCRHADTGRAPAPSSCGQYRGAVDGRTTLPLCEYWGRLWGAPSRGTMRGCRICGYWGRS